MRSKKFETTPEHSWQFEALGTQWEIRSRRAFTRNLKESIEREIAAFDATYSRFKPDSKLRQLAVSSDAQAFPKSAETLFQFYDELFAVTHGKVTPLAGDILAAAGYDEQYSLRPSAPPTSALHYPDVVKREGAVLRLTQPTQIDIGAVGKGYLIDVLAEKVRNAGHDTFVVDGSGDLRVVGERVERVGLEHPFRADEVIGVVDISNRALCASAINRRAWGDWHHIIDPETARPTDDIIATWVVADSAMIADGLATALFFVPPQTLAKKYNYEYLRMHANGSVEYSDYFARGVFS